MNLITICRPMAFDTDAPHLNHTPATAFKSAPEALPPTSDTTAPLAPGDFVSASACFAAAPEEVRQLHRVAVAYAASAGCSYADAVRHVGAI